MLLFLHGFEYTQNTSAREPAHTRIYTFIIFKYNIESRRWIKTNNLSVWQPIALQIINE